MAFLTGQSWRVLKSWHTGGDPEQGFRRCFADGLNQSLVSSMAQAKESLATPVDNAAGVFPRFTPATFICLI